MCCNITCRSIITIYIGDSACMAQGIKNHVNIGMPQIDKKCLSVQEKIF